MTVVLLPFWLNEEWQVLAALGGSFCSITEIIGFMFYCKFLCTVSSLDNKGVKRMNKVMDIKNRELENQIKKEFELADSTRSIFK